VKRVIQRTPDLGLKVRMVKNAAPVADCCVPLIGAAGWYNPVSAAYDRTLAIVTLSGSYYPYENGQLASLFTAQVNGKLCDAVVIWRLHWALAHGAGAPRTATPGRGLAVAISPADGTTSVRYSGVLTATATVVVADQTTTLAPLTLLVVDPYYG
jgi:hypothetical protein